MIMKEVQFKGKGNHRLMVKGKLLKFEEGKAMVTEEDAELIKSMKDKDYKVVEEKQAKKTVKKPKAKKKAAKKKIE